MISAASRAGTPKTEAGPVRKVAMPMFRLSGLSCAMAVAGSRASAAAIKSCRLMFPPNPCFLPRLLPEQVCLEVGARAILHNGTNRAPDGTRPLDAPGTADSADGDRIDDHLHGAAQAGVAEHKEKLPRLVGDQFAGIHVLKHVDTILGLQDLVHRESLALRLGRHRFHAPGVRTHSDHAYLSKIFGGGDSHSRLRRAETLQVRIFAVQQLHPVRVEEHDVAFADLDALPLDRKSVV